MHSEFESSKKTQKNYSYFENRKTENSWRCCSTLVPASLLSELFHAVATRTLSVLRPYTLAHSRSLS